MFLTKKGKKIVKASEADYELDEIANNDDEIKLDVLEIKEEAEKGKEE